MPFLAIDTETELFGPGNMAPRLVCLSWYDGKDSGLLPWNEVRDWLIEKLTAADSTSPVVLHHAAYDMAVLANQFPDLIPLIFQAYDENKITDTKIREKLYRIARGESKGFRYSLKDLALRYLNEDLDKTTWRTGYGELRNVPIEQWPQGAVDYARNDAVVTGQIYLKQEITDQEGYYIDQFRQAKASFALQLLSVWGLRTNKEAVEAFEKQTHKELDEIQEFLVKENIVRANGTRNMKLVQQILQDENPNGPKTPKGKLKADEEACKLSGDPRLMKLSRYRKLQTLITKDITVLKNGIEKPVHTNFEVLLETGRTSSRTPNIQNIRREPGIRECFVPRKGNVFISADYEMAELHTLAQVCKKLFGHSRLGDKLNENFDPHLDFASQLLGITYSEALSRKTDEDVKEARQRAKVANFGFPGGMGYFRFRDYAKKQGLELSLDEAKALKEKWKEAWPETKEYFQWVTNLIGHGEFIDINHLYSDRKRGSIKFTEVCNTFFQGLAADGAKEALYEVTKKCYNDPESPLFGCRPVNFIHDEIIVEAPVDRAESSAKELVKVMVDTFNKWVPDVPCKADSKIMERWSK